MTAVYAWSVFFTRPAFYSQSDTSKDKIQKIKTNNQQQQQKETKNKDNEKIILMTVMTFTIVIRSLNDKYCGPKS